MQPIDIRGRKFYVVFEREPPVCAVGLEPLDFDEAFQRAVSLVKTRRPALVLYTEGATQIQLTRLMSHGIQATPISEG